MKLADMRKGQIIQEHHWKAAKWFSELPVMHALQRDIKLECARMQSYGLDAYAVMRAAVVLDANVKDDPKVIGVLREALNICAHIARLI